MSQFAKKMKMVLNGRVHNKKSEKGSLIENDYLDTNSDGDEIDEFKNSKKAMQQYNNSNLNEIKVFSDYDNLHHSTTKRSAKIGLKDTTNLNKPNISVTTEPYSKPFHESKNYIYAKLYEEGVKCNEQNESKHEYENLKQQPKDDVYYEIANENEDLDAPLIDFKKQDLPVKRSNLAMFAMNCQEIANRVIKKADKEDQNNDLEFKDSKYINELGSFTLNSNMDEAFYWYLNKILDKVNEFTRATRNLDDKEKSKRLDIVKAHFLYARNFYDLRVLANSSSRKSELKEFHPCLVALVCLLDSGMVRITESHSCEHDSYVYFFATRLKFCAYNHRLFVILKRPNRSSYDRLNLIEDLKNCHKLIKA